MKKTLVFAAVAAVVGLAQADYSIADYYNGGSYQDSGVEGRNYGVFNFGNGVNQGGIWIADGSFVSFEGWDVYQVGKLGYSGISESSAEKYINEYVTKINTYFGNDTEMTKAQFNSIVSEQSMTSLAKVKDGKFVENRRSGAVSDPDNGVWVPEGGGNCNMLAVVISNASSVEDGENVLFASFVFDPSKAGGAIGTKFANEFAFTDWGYATTNVPEPTSGLLILLGMAGLALKRKHV